MEQPVRLVGGDLAVDFVNTVDADIPGGDHIATSAAFRAWCERLGLSAGRHTLAEVHGVRARIDAVLRAIATGDTPPPAALAALRDLVRDALARATLRPGGWEWPAGSALDRLVHAATELILSDRHHRLRRCANCTAVTGNVATSSAPKTTHCWSRWGGRPRWPSATPGSRLS